MQHAIQAGSLVLVLLGAGSCLAQSPGGTSRLTLDQAVERLIRHSVVLQERRQNLGRADADILVDGKRNNPFLYGTANNVPYGRYSEQRPGPVNYEVTVTQPVDVTGKVRRRLQAAYCARDVAEALYQNTVRREVARLYDAFLDVLAYQTLLHERLQEQADMDSDLQLGQSAPAPAQRLAGADLQEALLKRDVVALECERIRGRLGQKQYRLAEILHLPPQQAACLEACCVLDVPREDMPCVEELTELALQVRPDVVAERLSVRQTSAEIDEELAERWLDLYVLYTPFTFEDNSPLRLQSTTSWGLDVFFAVPILSRNQGELARARVTHRQARIELQAHEHNAIAEVQQAYTRYGSTCRSLRRYQQEVLPRALHARDEQVQRFQAGQTDAHSWWKAQQEYRKQVRSYLDLLLLCRYHRLRLDIAVGQRLDF